MSRGVHNYRLSQPRLYAVQIILKSGKIVNKMLGVAFTVNQRQHYYEAYKSYASWAGMWGDLTVKDVAFVSEKMTTEVAEEVSA